MSLLRRVRCDTCGDERDFDSTTTGWLTVRLGDPQHGPRRDFCSAACVAKWADENQPNRVAGVPEILA